MSDLSKKYISVKEYDSVSDYKDEKVKEEVIEILNFTPEEAFEMEKKGFFFMPNKITYIRKTATAEDVIKNLRRNKRKKIYKAIRYIKDLELVKEKTITKESFKEWYHQVYIPNLESKKIGILLVKETWWDEFTNGCKKLGIFFKKNGKIIAGIVARSHPKDKHLPRRISISLSATKKEFKNKGINDYLNILMIDFANEMGYDYLARGKDTNLYGKHLSAGLPVFKTALGYEIKPFKKDPDMLIKFNNLEKFEDVMFFVSYAKNSDKLIGNLILKKDVECVEDYNKPFFLKLRIFKYENKGLNLIKEKID